MNAREQLLDEIEKFLKRTGMPETQFGSRAVKDPALVLNMRNGRTVRIDTADKLRAFMRDYRPDTDGKPRPKKSADNSVAA